MKKNLMAKVALTVVIAFALTITIMPTVTAKATNQSYNGVRTTWDEGSTKVYQYTFYDGYQSGYYYGYQGTIARVDTVRVQSNGDQLVISEDYINGVVARRTTVNYYTSNQQTGQTYSNGRYVTGYFSTISVNEEYLNGYSAANFSGSSYIIPSGGSNNNSNNSSSNNSSNNSGSSNSSTTNTVVNNTAAEKASYNKYNAYLKYGKRYHSWSGTYTRSSSSSSQVKATYKFTVTENGTVYSLTLTAVTTKTAKGTWATKLYQNGTLMSKKGVKKCLQSPKNHL